MNSVFETLLKDVQNLILSYLPREDLLRLRRCSRSFYKVALDQRFQLVVVVGQVVGGTVSVSLITQVLDSLYVIPSIVHGFDLPKCENTEQMLNLLPTDVKYLRISWASIRSSQLHKLLRFSRLTNLQLKNCQRIENTAFQYLPSTLNNLTVTSTADTHYLTNELLTYLPTQLTELYLEYCYGITSIKPLRGMTSLQRLGLIGRNIYNEHLMDLPVQLKHLTLSCRIVTDEGCKVLPQGLVSLDIRLKLISHFDWLRPLTNLVSLTLRTSSPIPQMLQLKRCVPSLTRIVCLGGDVF